MKNAAVGDKKFQGKAGLSATALPWWAKTLIAKHAAASFPSNASHHIHHCAHCGCVVISTAEAEGYSHDVCLECNVKDQRSQGGN